MSLPEHLKFTVSLVDKITRPVAAISDSLRHLRDTHTGAAGQFADSAAGIAASGAAVYGMIAPALEYDRVITSLTGSGVVAESIAELEKMSSSLSEKIAVDTTEIMQHASYMKRIVGDVTSNVLADTVKASAVLQKAFNTDIETSTRLIKSLVGNYKIDAEKMGHDNFIKSITAMSVQAKKVYGVNLEDLEGMLTGMHGLTSGLGLSMQEQFSTMSYLNTFLDEGNATTYYTNFLEGAREASEKLGISFYDDNQKLLSMVEIVEKLAPKLKGIASQDARHILDEAGLGDGAIMIMKMVENLDDFKSKTAEFKKTMSFSDTVKQLQSMTHPFDQMIINLQEMHKTFSYLMVDALKPFFDFISSVANEIKFMIELLPNISKHIGYILLTGAGLGVLGGAIGIASAAFSGLAFIVPIATGAISIFSATMTWLKGAILAVNMAISLNPMVAIVAGVVAASAAIAYMIVKWDDLKAQFNDNFFVTFAMSILSPFKLLFEFIKGGWQFVASGFSDFSAFNGLFQTIEDLKSNFAFMFDFVGDKISWMQNIGGGIMSLFSDNNDIEAVQKARPTSLVKSGGIINQLSNSQSKSTTINGITINAAHLPDPYQIKNNWEMLAG